MIMGGMPVMFSRLSRQARATLAVGLILGAGLGSGASRLWTFSQDALIPRFWTMRSVLDNRGGFLDRRILGKITLYSSGYKSTGKVPGMRFYGYTHSGLPVGLGVAAADPTYYPPGTLIKVDGRYYVVADTGSEIKGPDRFDLYVASDAVADAAGSRLEWVDVIR